MKPLADKVGQQEADHQDDEQAKQEAEALMVSDEVCHVNTLLDESSNNGLGQRSWAILCLCGKVAHPFIVLMGCAILRLTAH